MKTYVRSLLDDLSVLESEWSMAREEYAKASVEFRYCKQAFEGKEFERQVVLSMIELWTSHPDTKFEERELLESAKTGLRSFAKKVAS